MRRYSTDKDLNEFCNEMVKNEKWEITFANNGHLKWMHPSGAMFFSSQTPSCSRTVENTKRNLKQALIRAGVEPHPMNRVQYQVYKQKLERKKNKMEQPLTHRLPIANPKPVTERPPVMAPKEILSMNKARSKGHELVKEGRTPEDATTVIMQVFDVRTGYGGNISRETLLRLIATPFPKRGKAKVEAAVAADAEAQKAAVKPRNVEVVEAKVKSTIHVSPSSDTKLSAKEIDEKVKHIRALIDMPFDKQKKIEIIIDLLDKLL